MEDKMTALEINAVFSEDCGTYSVLAKNLGGDSRTSCLLSLVDTRVAAMILSQEPAKPQFIQLLQNRDIHEGGRARLECVVTGYPQPEVRSLGSNTLDHVRK